MSCSERIWKKLPLDNSYVQGRSLLSAIDCRDVSRLKKIRQWKDDNFISSDLWLMEESAA